MSFSTSAILCVFRDHSDPKRNTARSVQVIPSVGERILFRDIEQCRDPYNLDSLDFPVFERTYEVVRVAHYLGERAGTNFHDGRFHTASIEVKEVPR